jgi:hypothetical protein
MDAIDYEQQGFINGVSAKTKSTGYKVLLVSNPKNSNIDVKPRVWVAMEFDTHVRYLTLVEDLELI